MPSSKLFSVTGRTIRKGKWEERCKTANRKRIENIHWSRNLEDHDNCANPISPQLSRTPRFTWSYRFRQAILTVILYGINGTPPPSFPSHTLLSRWRIVNTAWITAWKNGQYDAIMSYSEIHGRWNHATCLKEVTLLPVPVLTRYVSMPVSNKYQCIHRNDHFFSSFIFQLPDENSLSSHEL